jgi:hypothetical protein
MQLCGIFIKKVFRKFSGGPLSPVCIYKQPITTNNNFQYIDSHQEADDGEGDDADDVLVIGDRLLELLEAALHTVGVVRIVGVQSTLFRVFFAETFRKKFV